MGTKNLLCVLSLLQRQTSELCLGMFRRLRRNVVISPTFTVHGAAGSASAVNPTACYILMLQFAIAHNTQTQSLCAWVLHTSFASWLLANVSHTAALAVFGQIPSNSLELN